MHLDWEISHRSLKICLSVCTVRLSVRTSGFQPEKRGSTPLRCTIWYVDCKPWAWSCLRNYAYNCGNSRIFRMSIANSAINISNGNGGLVKWDNIGFASRDWEFDSLILHQIFLKEKAMKHRKQIAKKRNPFVILALFKKAGAHHKSNKAIRKAEKQKLIGGIT